MSITLTPERCPRGLFSYYKGRTTGLNVAVLAAMILSLLFAFFTSFSWAGKTIVWKPVPGHPGVLLVAEDHMTPRQAVERYWAQIQKDPELKSLLESSGYTPRMGSAREIDLFNREKPIVAVLANQFSDYEHKDDRVKIVQKLYEIRGYEVFVVGLAATAGVPRASAQEFRTTLAHQTEILFALGGDDVSPKLYNENLTHARNTVLARDKEEFRIIHDFKKAQKGFFVGICRGHQMGAIVDGHTLFQDLQKDSVTDHSLHRFHRHGMQWTEHAEKLFPAEALKTAVNSLHHQGVRLNPDASSYAIGFSTDGVVEALALRNGKGVSFQFHPEYMAARAYGANTAQMFAGREILFSTMNLESKTRQPRRQLCRRVYR